MPPLIVFDCMVFLQGAARKTSVAGACLEMAEQGHVRLCLSSPILAEIHDVLLRPEIRTRLPRRSRFKAADAKRRICGVGQGEDNVILFPEPEDHLSESTSPIHSREILGGLLKFHYREAV
jgi:predicted nucleic acid-binding protein